MVAVRFYVSFGGPAIITEIIELRGNDGENEVSVVCCCCWNVSGFSSSFCLHDCLVMKSFPLMFV